MPALVVALLVLAASCTPRPLLERAVQARGGPLAGFVATIAADVHAGAPGAWEWHRAFLAPDRYAWTIATAAEPGTYLFDGTTARAFIGGRQVAADASRTAPLRSHARWTAVITLAALGGPGVRATALDAAELPPGTVEGLAVTFADDGARYRLGFDTQALLVWAEGPLDLSPIGDGRFTAEFADFRRAGGLRLPFATRYATGGAVVAEERASAICPNPPGLDAAAFEVPGRLPACE